MIAPNLMPTIPARVPTATTNSDFEEETDARFSRHDEAGGAAAIEDAGDAGRARQRRGRGHFRRRPCRRAHEREDGSEGDQDRSLADEGGGARDPRGSTGHGAS